jgi:hypothetical protein
MHLQEPAIFISEDAPYLDFTNIKYISSLTELSPRACRHDSNTCTYFFKRSQNFRAYEKCSGHIFFFVFIYNNFGNIFISGKYLLKYT